MNNYLFLVNESESANGYCVMTVMKELVSRGNHVYCITNYEYASPTEYVREGIQFYTIRPRRTLYLQSILRHANSLNSAQRKLLKFAFSASNRISLAHSVLSWPLISPSFANRLYKYTVQIVEEKKIDIIVPVYSQIDTLIAANKVKDRCPNVKYVPYFLDSLSGGYGPKIFSNKSRIRRGIKWERNLLPSSDAVIVMESSRKHHLEYSSKENYFKKMIFLDLPLLINAEETDSIIDEFDYSRVNFVYVGTFLEGVRSPEYFLKIFSLMSGDRWQLYFIGDTNCDAINKASTKDQRIHVIGRCSHEDALRYIANASVLLNFGNTTTYMTPSKIFEYMSYGKPIISTMPIQDEPSAIYLSRYPHSLLLDEADVQYDIQAERVVNFVDRFINEKPVDFSSIAKLFHNNTPYATCEALEKIVSE